jgi:hypothetical protein
MAEAPGVFHAVPLPQFPVRVQQNNLMYSRSAASSSPSDTGSRFHGAVRLPTWGPRLTLDLYLRVWCRIQEDTGNV